MLKRSTKVTSLLVVAASIVSMIPAMAADVKKVASEDGVVYSSKSFADGTFIIDAELNGADEAIYSYKDGKYTKMENAEPGDAIGDTYTYEGNSYLEMADGDYYINLKTGERTDEDIKGDVNDDAASALRKKIKNNNDKRFSDSEDLHVADVYVKNTGSAASKPTIYGITGKWRQYFYTLETSKPSGATKSTVYSDDQGNYIDADYNSGKIGVYNTTGAGVYIENTEDTYELAVNGTKYEVKAQIQQLNSWDEGKEYITRTSALSIWGRVKGTSGAFSTNLTGDVYFGSSSNHHKLTTGTYTDDTKTTLDYNSVRVLQRISKAQASDDIDGIKYAKDVKTYFITDKDGAVQPLLGLGERTNASDASYVGFGLITGQTDGTLVSCYKDIKNTHVYAETINLKSENGYYYTDVDDVDDVDVDSTDCWPVGAGDIYALSSDGYIERFNGTDSKFEKLYKVDGGMNEISVSLPMFGIVWNQDDEIYSIIAPAAKTATTGATTAVTDTTATTGTKTTAPAVTIGWAKATDGTWSFVKADGTKATGWLQDGTTWYYLNGAGVMQTGWINDNGTWYYCNASGAMLANTTVDGYVLGASGAWVK